MPTAPWLRLFLRNLLLLVGAALPLLVVLLGLSNQKQVVDFLGEAVLLYVGFLGPMLIGGLVYLLCLFLLVRQWPNHGRIIAFLTAPVIAVGWALFGMGDIFSMTGFLISFAVSVLLYGALVRVEPAT